MMVSRDSVKPLFQDMECTVYRILITGYIDNELSDDEMQQLKTHLHTCEDCVAHLHKMEQIKTAFKHYHLIQELPEVSPNFTRNISRTIQGTIPAESRPSFLLKWFHTYQSFVFRFVETWISSLRAHPGTWVTSASCLVVLMAGLVFVDMTQTMSIQQPSSYITRPSADQESVAVLTPNKGLPLTPPTIPREEEVNSGLPEFIQFSDEPVIHVAKTNPEPVQNYVYSHVLEAAQEQFLDSAVFAGYVQDVRFQ